MIRYEDCLCDPDKSQVSLEIRGAGVIVTYTCPDCANEVYDTNFTLDEVPEELKVDLTI